jgi:hypothetical protein
MYYIENGDAGNISDLDKVCSIYIDINSTLTFIKLTLPDKTIAHTLSGFTPSDEDEYTLTPYRLFRFIKAQEFEETAVHNGQFSSRLIDYLQNGQRRWLEVEED